MATSKNTLFGPVAQRLEQGTHNPLVGGSNLSGPTDLRRLTSIIIACQYRATLIARLSIRPPEVVCHVTISVTRSDERPL